MATVGDVGVHLRVLNGLQRRFYLTDKMAEFQDDLLRLGDRMLTEVTSEEQSSGEATTLDRHSQLRPDWQREFDEARSKIVRK